MLIDPAKLAAGDICEFAKQRYYEIARWRQLWTILIFVLGLTFVILLVGALVFAFNQKWFETLASSVATVVNGAGVAWVLARRGEAVQEEEKAYDDVKKQCGDTTSAQIHKVVEGPESTSRLLAFALLPILLAVLLASAILGGSIRFIFPP